VSQIQVMKCDVCGKLLPAPDLSKGIHTEDADYCENCLDNIKRDIKGVQSLRAYHVLADIAAKILADETAEKEAEESAKKTTGTEGTSGFSPAAHH